MEVPWLVEGIISEGDICIFSGSGGTGKSYMLMHMAIAMAKGSPVFGSFPTTRKFNVAYFDKEMPLEIVKMRFQRMLHGENIQLDELENLKIVTGSPLLLNWGQDVSVLEDFITENKLDVLFFDSLRTMFNGSESDSEVVNAVHRTLAHLQQKFPALTFIFIHHWNKPPRAMDGPVSIEGRMRGSSRWRDICGAHFGITQPRLHRMLITQDKARHETKMEAVEIQFIRDDHDDPEGPFRLEVADRSIDAPKVKKVEEYLMVHGGQAPKVEIGVALDLASGTMTKIERSFRRIVVILGKRGRGGKKTLYRLYDGHPFWGKFDPEKGSILITKNGAELCPPDPPIN